MAGLLLLALWAGSVGARVARAHEFEPALLSLRELASDEYELQWRLPARMAPDALRPAFPPGSQLQVTTAQRREADAWVERLRLHVPGGLAGQAIAMRGAAAGSEEVLLRLELRGGLVMGRVSPGGVFQVPRSASAWAVARSYLELGIEHILTGFDHLLFVLGLVLLAPSLRALIAAVSGFTLAHSITLALAALALVALPSPPVEASIALSIMFVARELWALRRDGGVASGRRLAGMAFAFGLLHGLGFAGALSEIGLPQGDVPLALLSFNLGVELGQLAFVAAVRLAARALPSRVREPMRPLAPYAIGAVAAYFLFERVAGMLS